MTSSSKSAAEDPSANAGTAVNAEAAPVKRYSLYTASCLIVGIFVGIYACMTFNLPGTFAWQMGIGLVFLLACTAWNILWPTLSGYFQNLTTLAKTLPLVLVGVIGLMVNDPVAQLSSDIAAAPAAGTAWIAAAAPIAVAFDGWSSAVSINLPGTFAWQMGIGLVFLLACTAWNILWPTLSGYFQNLTTLAKTLPLVLVGVIGLMVNDPVAQLSSDIAAAPAAGTAWIAAAAPIAVAFDGWSSAVSIAPELKDARCNLPRALVAAPIIILVLYLGYFVGISCFLGPQTVIQAGDASLSLMFVKLFGEQAGALPNVIAFIAVLGGANGMVLATLRMPQSLALHHMMPCERAVSRMNPKLQFPVASALIALATTLFWVAVHTVVSALGLLPNGDISEVVVAMTMMILALYYAFGWPCTRW